MTNALTITNNELNLVDYKDLYLKRKRKNLLKKISIRHSKSKQFKKVIKVKFKFKFKNKNKNKYKRTRKYSKYLYKVSKRPKHILDRAKKRLYYFIFGSLLRKAPKKYQAHYKRYYLGNSKLHIFGPGRDRCRYAWKKILAPISFNRRFIFKRLPRLFFFWFLVLYSDMHKYLSKIIWSNWFKFLYTSFGFHAYSKLYYSAIELYNINYNKRLFYFNNYAVFYNNEKFNVLSFLKQRLNLGLGSFIYFFFNGIFFYDLKYISMSSRRNVNLYVNKSHFSKKNISLKRFFLFKY